MKLLVTLLLIVAAVGCTRKSRVQANQEDLKPKLTFGQEVTVATGFYRGATARIAGYSRCKEDGHGTLATDVVCYDVTLKSATGEEMSVTNYAEREILGE